METKVGDDAGLTSVRTESTEACAMRDKLFYVEKICMNANESCTMWREYDQQEQE
jgi:hypothetical protein